MEHMMLESWSHDFTNKENIYRTKFFLDSFSQLSSLCFWFLSFSFLKLQFSISCRNASSFIIFLSCLFSPLCINTCSSSSSLDSSAFPLLHHHHGWQFVNKELLSIFSTSSGLRPKNTPTLYISLFGAGFSIRFSLLFFHFYLLCFPFT